MSFGPITAANQVFLNRLRATGGEKEYLGYANNAKAKGRMNLARKHEAAAAFARSGTKSNLNAYNSIEVAKVRAGMGGTRRRQKRRRSTHKRR
jgi:hypothetical protein